MSETKSGMAPQFKSQLEQAKSIANIHVALAEFIDNSLDVGSTQIKISSSVGDENFDLFICDNGDGMTLKKLMSSLKLGSSQKSNSSKEIFGCKGVGMKLGATRLAKESLKIFSKTSGSDKISYSKFNIHELRRRYTDNDWDSLYSFDQFESRQVESSIVKNFLDDVDSGTVIQLVGMDKDVCGEKKQFDKKILQSSKGIRRIYRHVITEREVEIVYNSSKVIPSGPAFDLKEKYQDHVFNMVHSDNDGWIKGKVFPWGTSSYDYRFRFIRVANKTNLGTSAQSGGLCILRNKREVTSQLIPHIRPKNFAIGNLVIELDCPSEFIDKALTFNGDKQLRSLEDANNAFDFRQWCKNIFKPYWDSIIEINLDDGKKGSEEESYASWKHDEKTLVERFYNSQKENMSVLYNSEQIDKLLIKEYQIPGTGFKLDLVSNGIPFEFKTRSDDPTKIVGQILSYLPYLVDNEEFSFVENNKLIFKLALGETPTESLKRHVKKINESYSLHTGLTLEIQIFDMTEKCPTLLDFPMTRKEKNRINPKINKAA